jgi:hypothetical protein
MGSQSITYAVANMLNQQLFCIFISTNTGPDQVFSLICCLSSLKIYCPHPTIFSSVCVPIHLHVYEEFGSKTLYTYMYIHFCVFEKNAVKIWNLLGNALEKC